jgi:DNA-binding transcriptional MerR regulator
LGVCDSGVLGLRRPRGVGIIRPPMTGKEQLLRPGEASKAIGIKPSTLRVYVQRFGELLSDDAKTSEGDGHRYYSQRDIETLRRARELIRRGLTYQRALAELRGTPTRSRRADPEANPVTIGLQALEQAVDAWRQLAEERANEIAALRADIRRLQEMLLAGSHLKPLPRAAERR